MISWFVHKYFVRHCRLRSSRPEVFCKKGFLRNFAKFTGTYLCQCLFFNVVAGLRTATLLKKGFWKRCFPVNFAKFLRNLFSQNTSGGCFFVYTNIDPFWVNISIILAILTGKDWSFSQFSTGMAGWLLLIFLICLHNQLSSIHSIISTDVWKMGFIKLTVKMDGCSAQQVLRQNLSFCLNTGKRFLLEVSFSSQQKEHRFF